MILNGIKMRHANGFLDRFHKGSGPDGRRPFPDMQEKVEQRHCPAYGLAPVARFQKAIPCRREPALGGMTDIPAPDPKAGGLRSTLGRHANFSDAWPMRR